MTTQTQRIRAAYRRLPNLAASIVHMRELMRAGKMNDLSLARCIGIARAIERQRWDARITAKVRRMTLAYADALRKDNAAADRGAPSSYNAHEEAEAFFEYLNEFAEMLGIDVEPEPAERFLNHYDCPECGTHWTTRADSMCDDRCPSCNLSCSPVDSEDLEPEAVS